MRKFSVRKWKSFVWLIMVLIPAVVYIFFTFNKEKDGFKPMNVEPVNVEIPTNPISNQVIITFDTNTKQEEKNEYINRINGKIIGEIDSINSVIVALNDTSDLENLTKDKIVISSEPDYYVVMLESGETTQTDTQVVPNDPRFSEQWALQIVGWSNDSTDSENEKIIAVVDSGVCFDHPDLNSKIVEGWDFVENDNTPQDENGHGCEVSGVIAANINNNIGISGVSKNAKIMPLKVLDASGIGSYSNVAAAIVYAVDHGANIINLSLGGVNSSIVLENAVNYAKEKGITLVAAAGNTGTEQILYPAAYDYVIAVGSVDPSIKDATGEFDPQDYKSSFSAYGSKVDVWAPGRDILTTNKYGDYSYVSGTSFAAPVVSGIVSIKNISNSDLQTIVIPSQSKDGIVTSQIVGGSTVNYPWVVAIFRGEYPEDSQSSEQYCGGTLISSNWILTARHCITEFVGVENPLEYIRVSIGVSNISEFLNNSSQLKEVDGVYYPNDSGLFESDIALLHLKISQPGPYLSISENDANLLSGSAKAIGWGVTDDQSNESSTQLNEIIEDQFVNISMCQNALLGQSTSDKLLCTYSGGTKHTADGDSGGPLFVDNELVGIITNGDNAGYDLFTRVSKYYSWIASYVFTSIDSQCNNFSDNSDVELYKGINCTSTGENKLSYTDPIWINLKDQYPNLEDQIFSIKVKEGWSVKVYQHYLNYGDSGQWRCINHSMWDLSQDRFEYNSDGTANGNGEIIGGQISSFAVFDDNNCGSLSCPVGQTLGAQGCSIGGGLPPTSQGDNSDFISDVNIPDGTSLPTNYAFTKIWRFQNTGTTTWNQSYKLVFQSGTSMTNVSSVNLPTIVSPNGTLDISINLTTPSTDGSYIGKWILVNQNGQQFGDVVWVKINVSNTTQTPTTSGQVKLYSEANYSGLLNSYGTGDTNDPSANSYSLEIPGGWSVRTFKGDNFSGEEKCWYESVSNLQDHGWQNAIQSMKVYNYNFCSGNQKVKLYANANYDNLVGEYDLGKTDNPSKNSYSMFIPTNWSVVTYDQDGLHGRSRCWSASTSNLQDHESWNLAIDSMEIFSTNVCPDSIGYVRICRDTGGTNCINISSSAPSLGNIGFGNDTLKSIYIAGDWQVVLFEDDNYGGRFYQTNSSQNDLGFLHGSPGGFDPNGYGTSSIQVRRTSPAVFTLYSLGDFNDGGPLKSDRSIPDLSIWKADGGSWNDRAQSMRVDSSYEIIGCSDAGFHGTCGRTKSDKANLNDLAQGLYNGLSSVQVCKDSCPPVPVTPVINSPLNQVNFLPGSQITFNWDGNGDTFYVEISGGGLSSPRTFGWSSVKTWSVSDLPASSNQYYWKVKSWNPYGESNWSTQQTFYVQDIVPTQVFLVGPGTTDLNTDISLTAYVNPADASNIVYTWSPSPKSGQGLATAIYNFDNPGNKIISLTVSNSGGSIIVNKIINIGCPEGEYLAEYYSNADLSGNPIKTQCETSVNYDWGSSGPEFLSGFGDGHDGDITVAANQTAFTDNTRTPLVNTVSAGAGSICVTTTSNFHIGDEIIIIQMTGSNTGNYEFNRITSINSCNLGLKTSLVNSYDTSTGKTQVIGVINASSLIIEANAKLMAHAWDGQTGGVLAIRVLNDFVIKETGLVTMTALGYRGASQNNSSGGGSVGEGEFGFTGTSTSANGMGAGGGCSNGYANPGAGGGGGNANKGQTGGPGNGTVCLKGGEGGNARGDVALTKLVMGGGGGSGGGKTNEGSNNYGGAGGTGGGIIFLSARNLESYGRIESIGTDGANSGSGGASGGGAAGGSIKIERLTGTNNLTDSGVISVSGGIGGPQNRGTMIGGAGSIGRYKVSGCENNCTVDNFSVRWTQKLSTNAANYTFSLKSDDGVKLWIDNNLVIDKWIVGYNESSSEVSLTEGIHDIKVEYYEGTGNAQIQLNAVEEVNNTPVFNTIPNQTIDEDTSFVDFDLDSYTSDSNQGDTLTYSFSGNNNLNVNIDSSNVVKITSPSNWNGQETITFRVTDQFGLYAETMVVFKVNSVNDLPVITSQAITSANINREYQYQLVVNDVDNDIITYNIITFPTNMVIDNNGLIKWTPDGTKLGNNDVIVEVSDGIGAVTQTFVINVTYSTDDFITSIDDHMITLDNWNEDETGGFVVTNVNESLKVTTNLNNDSAKRFESKWINVEVGKIYYLQTRFQVKDSDAPKAIIRLYDINFNLLGDVKVLPGGSGTRSLSEYRTSYKVPAKYNNIDVKYAKIVLEAGDILSTTTATESSTLFDDVYFSQNGRPYSSFKYSPTLVKEGDVVTLDGSASRDYGNTNPINYEWIQIAGPTITIANANAQIASFIPVDLNKDYKVTIQLTVNDGQISSIPVTKEISVKPVLEELDEEFINQDIWINSSTTNFSTDIEDEALKISSLSNLKTSVITTIPFIMVDNSIYKVNLKIQTENVRIFNVRVYGYNENFGSVANKLCTYSTMTGTKSMREVSCDTDLFTQYPTIKYAKVRIEVSSSITGFSYAWIDSIKVKKSSGNITPTIVSQPVTTGIINTEYKYQMVVNDPDNTNLTYELIESPSGMMIDTNGLITWQTTSEDLGDYNVVIHVTDGENLVEQIYNLNISFPSSEMVSSIDDHFVNNEQFQEDLTEGFNVSNDNESLRISTSLNNDSKKRFESKWIMLETGKTYYIAVRTKVQSADSPKVLLNLYDAKSNFLGTVKSLTGGSGTRSYTEYRTGYTIPLSYAGAKVKYAKLVLESGDILSSTTATESLTWFDDIYFSQNGRPYSSFTYSPNIIKEGDVVTLDATLSKDYGSTNPLTYAWTQVSGPTVVIENANQKVTSFTAVDLNMDYKISIQLVVSDGQVDSIPLVKEISVKPWIENLDEEFINSNLWINSAPTYFNSEIENETLKLTSLVNYKTGQIITSPFIKVESAPYKLFYKLQTNNVRAIYLRVYGYNENFGSVANSYCSLSQMTGTKPMGEGSCSFDLFVKYPTIKYIKVRVDVVSNTTGISTVWVDYLKLIKENQPPLVYEIPSQTINEDDVFGVFDLDEYGNDPDSDPITWSYSGNSNISVTIDSENRITSIPASNWNGEENITFTATDQGGLSSSVVVLFKVNPVNDTPIVSMISGQTINQGETFSTIDLKNFGTDTDTNEVLTWTVSGNTNLQVSIDSNSIAIITYQSDWFGEENLTFTITDNSGASASTTTLFKVNQIVVPEWKIVEGVNVQSRGLSITTLNDGKILLAGGWTNGAQTTSCSIFDPSTKTISATGNLLAANSGQTATLLNDGRVLITGGYSIAAGGAVATAEIYDPTTGIWSAAPSMTTARYSHTASLLPDGKVMVVGGFAPGSYDAPTEVYDPITNTWSLGVNPSIRRGEHTATTLTDGRIVIIGGYRGPVINSVEVFNPSTNTWTTLASMNNVRTRHSATLLPDGRIFVAGGWNGNMINTAEIYNTSSNTWTNVDYMPNNHADHTAELLNGKVFILGGSSTNDNAINNVDVYDVATATWSTGPTMNSARRWHKSKVIDGIIYVFGGNTGVPTDQDLTNIETLIGY